MNQREIKFRTAILNDKNELWNWHCWGFINRGFVAPQNHQDRNFQFTGLKDKNGKEIYEGDIVKGLTWKEPMALKTSKEIKGEVQWSDWDNGWHIHSKLPKGFRTFIGFRDCEVIGNVMENPELLT